MYAYFQSAMVVDFLVGTYGEERFRGLLDRLRRGEPANDALAESFEKMGTLQSKSAFAKAQAEAYGLGVDWTRPDEVARGPFQAEDPLKAHPQELLGAARPRASFWRGKRWEDAVRSAEIQIGLFPSLYGRGQWLRTSGPRAGRAWEMKGKRPLCVFGLDAMPPLRRPACGFWNWT